MFFRLLIMGLVLLPFYEFFLYLLMPGAKVPEWIDMRVTKEYIAVGLAMALTLIVWIKKKRIECPNIWAAVFVGFLFLNLSKTPISVTNTIIDVSRMGSFPGEFKVLAFFMFFCAMTTMDIGRRQIRVILKTIYLCGMAMAVYMVIQALRLDQIYRPLPSSMIGAVKNPAVAGFFGQPTLAVPFLCLTAPIAVYFKEWIGLGLIAVAAVLTGSDFAIICLFLLLLLYSFRHRILFVLTGALMLPCLFLLIKHPAQYFRFSGRLEVWAQILKDVFTGQINNVTAHIGMTGAGINNFGSVFTALHSSPWTTAHNEYLQVLWTCGVIGFVIFLMIHIDVLKVAWMTDWVPASMALSLSILMLLVCAMGTFVFQLGVYQVYVIALVGLLYQIQKKGLFL